MNLKQAFINFEKKIDDLTFVMKLRSLPEIQKIAIFFLIMAISGIIMFFFAVNLTQHKIAAMGNYQKSINSTFK